MTCFQSEPDSGYQVLEGESIVIVTGLYGHLSLFLRLRSSISCLLSCYLKPDMKSNDKCRLMVSAFSFVCQSYSRKQLA